MIKLLQEIGDRFENSLTIADMSVKDQPLIYVNQKFSSVTGYSYDESVGRNCRFLQGNQRDQEKIEFIHNCFNKASACCVDLVNFRKNNQMFINRLVLLPIKDENQLYFIGLQNDLGLPQQNSTDVRNIKSIEIRHHINNPLQILLGSTELLKFRERLSSDKIAELSKKVETSLRRIDHFVTHITDISEFEKFK